MCGRFTLNTPEGRIMDAFHLEHTEPVGLTPRFNVAPSQDSIIIRDSESAPAMIPARWGLVPSWSEDTKSKYSTFNARIESVAEKPIYRSSFRHKHCLISADGFYECRVVNGHMVPHYIRLRAGGVFPFGGLWDHREHVNLKYLREFVLKHLNK